MKCGWCERPLGEDDFGPVNHGTDVDINEGTHRGPKMICNRCLDKPDWIYRCETCGKLMDERVCPYCSTRTKPTWQEN